MIAQELTLRSLDLERDAEKLAAMWNASDEQWPGTWTEGVPMTAERVIDWHKRLNPIDVLIWDGGDAIAGYCSLWNWPTEENVTYIALLNVAPGHQKQSLGRKFLTTYVDRVVGLGSKRLDLHTWSGNLKAMPLYKKCGFYWLPGTSVHMFNYMPAILTMPLAQDYFQKHDWYKTFKRNLAQVEDDEQWQGMNVFTYHFAEGDDQLTVWADREARAITAIETNSIFAAAIADNIEPPRGLATTIRWQLTNKSDKPQQIALIANGDENIKINYRKSLQLAPGESTTLEASVAISATAPAPQKDMPTPAVRSALVIDGQMLELATGFRPRAAVEVATEPRFISVRPGVTQEAVLQLRSRLNFDVTATVGITPTQGLTCDGGERVIALPAGGRASIPVKLRATVAGTHQLAVAVSFEQDGKQIQIPPAELAVFAAEPGGLLGAKVGGVLRVENDFLRLTVREQGGGAELFNRLSGEKLGNLFGYAAPPMAPSEYRGGKFELSLEQEQGELIAVATMASQENPGFTLQKRFAVNAGPLLAMSYDFINLSSAARRFKAMFDLRDPRGEDATLTLPLKVGLVSERFSTFPGPDDEEFKKPASYDQPWGALESRFGTLGAIWADDLEEVVWSSWWEASLVSDFYECPPQSRTRTNPLRLFVGRGGWQAVRDAWLQSQGVAPDTNEQQPVSSLNARLEQPVVAADTAAQTTMRVEHLIPRKLNGVAKLVLPAGWQADKAEFVLSYINWQNPFTAEVQISASGKPGASAGVIKLQTDKRDADFEFSLVRLGDGRTVEVREAEQAEQKVLTIANGLLEIDVTPEFGGAVSAIREGETNHLASPFPNVGAFGWMSPWYGGVMPTFEMEDAEEYPGKLGQEKYTVHKVSASEEAGAKWVGVRQQADLQNPELRGIKLEIDTLTVGGSNVVKHQMRLINGTSVVRRLKMGFMVYVQPDGSRAKSTMHSALGQLKYAEWNPWLTAGNWVAAQNPETGRAIALVSPTPDVAISSWGAEGGHLSLAPTLLLPANGAVELTGYIVVAPDIEAVRHYSTLKDLK